MTDSYLLNLCNFRKDISRASMKIDHSDKICLCIWCSDQICNRHKKETVRKECINLKLSVKILGGL